MAEDDENEGAGPERVAELRELYERGFLPALVDWLLEDHDAHG